MSDRRRHDLYRFYDAHDRLLYIGISLNAAQRASQHKADKPWWDDVDRMVVDHLGDVTRSEAMRVERDAIVDERPLYNVVHNQDGPQGGVTGDRLTWLCELCGDPIDGVSGYVELPEAERRRFRREVKAWEARYPDGQYMRAGDEGEGDQLGLHVFNMEAIFDRPPEAHWWAIHRCCDPDPQGSGYHFTVDRISTPWDFIQWTHHLYGKRWVDDTDWWELMDWIKPGVPIDTRKTRDGLTAGAHL